MDINLEKWYRHNYLEYGDDVARMANYLSIKLRVSEYELRNKLRELKSNRVREKNRKIRMNKILYNPASKWFRYLESEMFKRW